MSFSLYICTLILNPISAFIMFCILLTARGKIGNSIGYRIGLAVALSGLIGQIVWTVYMVRYGVAPPNEVLPWWIGKDLGYFIFVAVFMWRYLSGKRDFDISLRTY